MGIAATCTDCGSEFSFVEVRNAKPNEVDRCPRCGQRVGIIDIGPLAARADAALDGLARYLRMLSEHQPAFPYQGRVSDEPAGRSVGRWRHSRAGNGRAGAAPPQAVAAV